MTTKKPQLKTYLTEVNYIKFKEIAHIENRSVSNLLETLIIQKIESYEKQNGEIKIKNLNIIDNKGTINM